MKQTVLLLSFFFFSTLLFAQQQAAWQRDSVYYKRQFGQIGGKTYYFFEKNNPKLIDSTVTYLLDGRLCASEVVRGNSVTTQVFDKNGQIQKKKTVTQTATNTYTVIEIHQQKTKSFRSETQQIGQDAFRLFFDTTFYAQNRIKTIEHSLFPLKNSDEQESDKRYLRREWYDENGRLHFALPPDSVQFIAFKDNERCLYGFKNRRGDTLVAPKFNAVEKIGQQFWLCEDGDNKVLMRSDGTLVTKEKYPILKPIKENTHNTPQFYLEENTSFLNTLSSEIRFFAFVSKGLYGVLDSSGKFILPPQYDEITEYDAGLNAFIFEKKARDGIRKMGVIDLSSGEIIGQNRFQRVLTTVSKDFFLFSDKLDASTRRVGLINRQGDILLTPDFDAILHFSGDLFWIDKTSEEGQRLYESPKRGLYDARNRRWILEPVFQSIADFNNPLMSNLLYHTEKKQCGVMDTTGVWLLKPEYDTIMWADTHLFIVGQKGKYTLFDARQQENISSAYQYLSAFKVFNNISLPNLQLQFSEDETYFETFFIAKKQEKWGIINQKEAIIVPFQYQYAGIDPMDKRVTALVKGNRVSIFSQDVFPKPLKKDYFDESPYHEGAYTFQTQNNTSTFFTFNDKGSVVGPPQYKMVSKQNFDKKYPTLLVKTPEGKRKIIFSKDGQSADFPFSEPLLWASPQCPLVLLGQTQENGGIKAANLKTGQVVKQLEAGGLSVGDVQNGTFFAKINLPYMPSNGTLPTVSTDTLLVDDDGWLMYDATGKQISKEVFRFPISFHNGIGWGMVGEKCGLWRSNGAVILPPQYENAFRDDKRGSFAFFQNRGLKNWLVLFDKNGKQLVEAGRYDGISDFYGQYALVKRDKMVGLLDSSGREIVPLMDISASARFNFRDSLNLVNTTHSRCRVCDTVINYFGQTEIYDKDRRELPLKIFSRNSFINHPDSLKLSEAQRNMVWNHLVEAQIVPKMHTAATQKIERAVAIKTYRAYREVLADQVFMTQKSKETLLYDIFVDSHRIAFSLLRDTTDKAIYYNFTKKGDTWHPLSINDLFNGSADNTQKINDLLAQKIRQLSDKDIDCGASESYWERGQNHFLVQKEGLVFYFTTKTVGNASPFQRFFNTDFEKIFVPILITWGEMGAFFNQK